LAQVFQGVQHRARDLSSIFDGLTDILVNFKYLKRLVFGQQATFRGPLGALALGLSIRTVITACSDLLHLK
jgi:hypothetical protein